MATCDFCDTPAKAEDEQCSSCHASFRLECPKCGALKSIFANHCAACGHPPVSPPAVVGPPETPVPVTAGSVILRLFGGLQIFLGLWALTEGIWPVSLLCLAVLIFCFVAARMRDVTEATWRRLERIETELTRRNRRPD